jgi:hypothetical protein
MERADFPILPHWAFQALLGRDTHCLNRWKYSCGYLAFVTAFDKTSQEGNGILCRTIVQFAADFAAFRHPLKTVEHLLDNAMLVKKNARNLHGFCFCDRK